MGWVSDEVLLELVKLSREVLIHEKDLTGAVDRLTSHIDVLTQTGKELLDENAEIRGDIGELINLVKESAVNSEAIALAKKNIDAITAKAGTLKTATQAVEDKLKEAGKE